MAAFSKYHISDYKPGRPMGRALIVNVNATESPDGSTYQREGSLKDAGRLEFIFKYLNFAVVSIEDPTGLELCGEILKFIDSINKDQSGMTKLIIDFL